jgi:protein SCO1
MRQRSSTQAQIAIAFAMLATFISSSCSSKPALPSYGVVPDFTLTDQTGAPFSSKQRLDGSVWIADFIFTTCQGPCPRMSSQMAKLRNTLPRESVRFVSFTIDPDRDTPPVLAEYAKRFQAHPAQWHFLTGTRQDLNRLSFHTFKLGNVDGNLEHSSRFVLVDAKGRIRGFYDTSDPEALKQIAADVRRLLESNA